MKMFKIVKKFNADEEGAVTVDWVVLTAAVVGLGAAALTMVRNGTKEAATDIGTYMSGVAVESTF
jgi:Flp pilus assembly pilin Flp